MKIQRKHVLAITIIAVFLLPVIYLFVKSDHVKDAPPNVAIDSLENAVKMNPDYQNLINLSVAYINNKMPGKSITHLKKAIELNPKSAIAYNNLGVAYIQLQQYQDGVDACLKASGIDGSLQLAKNNLNWGLSEIKSVKDAIQSQEQTPDDKRDNAFYISYGLNHFKLGNYIESIRIYTKITQRDPNNVTALNNIGTALMMQNKHDEAISIFRKILAVEPDNQLVKNNLSWALDEKNKSAGKL